MSVTVDQSWVYRFHNNILLTYQQQGSLLERLIDPSMVHRDVSAQIDHHERMGAAIANDQVNPFGQTQVLNPPHSRRAVQLQSSDATVLVSDEHNFRSMVNPQSAYTRTIVAAIGRRADKHIIDAALGSAQVAAVTPGSGVITYTSQVLPSAQKFGAGTAMDLARIIAAGVRLTKLGVPPGPGKRKFIYGPGQETDIMAITQASSSDFTKMRIHDSGTINGNNWQGFDWVLIADVYQIDLTSLQTMLPLVSTTRSCIAMANDAVGLSIGRPAGAPSISIRNDLQSDPIQVKQKLMMAAVRVFEAGVCQVDALEN